ncbi:fungal-specific transcription factor domain-containing protein [Phlebopus sp. FC_14]|nr:fungal-specific transcription factor domain-containing protein [Phlebopus sp. FC_14]
MTHILPPHTDLNLAPSSLHSALHMDHAQPQQQPNSQVQQQQSQQQAPQQSSKKRRKTESNADDVSSPSEPRRLRRSHEACARCRSKKIKCDSKHPKCTACATAGVPCQQEDRHRQTLTLRGHTEFIERQIALCDALLKRHIPGFSLANLEEHCAREGVDMDGAPPPPPDFQNGQPFSQQHSGGPPASSYYPPLVPPGYPPPGVPIYGPYPPHIPIPGPPGHYGPHIHPGFPPPPQHLQTPAQQIQPHPGPPPPPPPAAALEVKGQDPQSLDMSDTRAIAKSFGVHPLIVNETQLATSNDKEDLAVGSNGLTSGRDQAITEASVPRDPSKWISISVAASNAGSPSTTASKLNLWLPKDRKMVNNVVDVYFNHLNIHRPVFFRSDFESRLNSLYEMENVQHDPGFICSMYLILALGTLSELNHKVTLMDHGPKAPSDSPILSKKQFLTEWPEHYEFFERALVVKPHLRVTITSLQALILLQWYLYTERQGRSLWRLVGSLVRLSIELGLHHDPTCQNNTFTEEEAQLRIRLWGIVMVHDRGTSILLGRPLAISPSDSNTPHPSRPLKGLPMDFSEHFLLSHPMAEIQADIINSLYAPSNKSADTIIRHATRIIKSMVEFRRQLPESYRYYFGGTEDWPLEKRQELVRDITEDQGLTLLKLGISRILLLRAIFSLKELDYAHRSRALVDAIVTSHNIIVVHNQLIRFPDIAFFTSPIPLHIAAMVILYGHMSHCERLPRQVMIEDVWMALDMLPRFRWRWERKDLNGGHPLISKLAEKVLNVNLHSVGPTKDPVLLSELDWDMDNLGMISSPSMASQQQPHMQQQQQPQQKTPTMAHPPYPNGHGVYATSRTMQQNSGVKSVGAQSPNVGTSSASGDKLAEVPTGLFYPFYPENPMGSIHSAPISGVASDGSSTNGDSGNGDYSQLLAAAAAQPNGSYGCQQSQDSYMLEEIVPASAPSSGRAGTVWLNVNQRGAPQYMTGS